MIEPVSAAVVEAAEVTEAVAEVSEVAGEASEALPQDVLDTPLESFGQEGGNMLDKGKVLEGKEVVMNEPLKTLSQDVLDTPLEPFGEESEKSLGQNGTEQYNPFEDVKNEVDYAKEGDLQSTENSVNESENKEIDSPYSEKINSHIRSQEEADVYKDANLREEEVDGRECLVRDDIDPEQTDEFGQTNKERMEKGLAPLDKNGNEITLHHIGQKMDSPLAELTREEHQGNTDVLHDPSKPSEIDRDKFKTERQNHWKERAKDFE